MYRIKSGSISGQKDSAAFLGLLDNLPRDLAGETGGFFVGAELIVSRAPGRIDLMGGIGDYSGSLVLQLPIASATHVALELREELTVRIVSLPTRSGESLRSFEISLADLLEAGRPIGYDTAAAMFKREPEHQWAAYVAGAFLVLMRERDWTFKQGARILISSAVPEGKGVSSSAALEVAVMQAVAAAYQIEISAREIAFLCQRVENLVAGAPCGVMDQMTAACGEADRLLVLLCQPGRLDPAIALPEELAVWGLDSGTRHTIGGADYRTVRTAAFMGYRMIAEMAGLSWHETDKTDRPGLIQIADHKWGGYLANITPADFEQSYASRLPPEMRAEEFLRQYKGITDSVTVVEPGRTYPVLAATRHPIHENARVNAFAAVLKHWKDLTQAAVLGELMYESHRSYSACGLGSAGTDLLVDLVRSTGSAAGLYGARITGGGSGGTVAVLGDRKAGSEIEAITDLYAQQTGYRPIVISGSSPGAGVFGHLRLGRE